MTTGSPHGPGKAVSPPKVSLGSVSLAERSETVACGLGNLAVTLVTLQLEMPSSSHMLWFVAFDGSHGVEEWGSPWCGYQVCGWEPWYDCRTFIRERVDLWGF